MKNILLVNDLRRLPNFGCRTTGRALERMLRQTFKVKVRDGLETVSGSGWDDYSLASGRVGGAIPSHIHSKFWRLRKEFPSGYSLFSNLDRILGARKDFVGTDAEESAKWAELNAPKSAYLTSLLNDIKASDAVVINGEGTVIVSAVLERDCRFALFIIALCHRLGKPIYLLNAMLSRCPYERPSDELEKRVFAVLAKCEHLVLRDYSSIEYATQFLPKDKFSFAPDALFTFADVFSGGNEALKAYPNLAMESVSSEFDLPAVLSRPYVCISGSSSGWRFGDAAVSGLAEIAHRVRKLGFEPLFLQTCSGDSYLFPAAQRAGAPLIDCSVPVCVGGAILRSAAAYVSGRYHPAIMAASNGVETIFMESNSHKTLSLQKLLNVPNPLQFSLVPDESALDQIVARLRDASRGANRSRIMDAFEVRANEARGMVGYV